MKKFIVLAISATSLFACNSASVRGGSPDNVTIWIDPWLDDLSDADLKAAEHCALFNKQPRRLAPYADVDDNVKLSKKSMINVFYACE